jgi:hypothetical protein
MLSQRLIRCSLLSSGNTIKGVRQRNRSLSSFLRHYLRVEDEVQEALRNGEPVVALESTIVAHGMPYPQNLDTGRSGMPFFGIV